MLGDRGQGDDDGIGMTTLAPPLAEIGLRFGLAENVSLMLLGIVVVAVMSEGSLLGISAMILTGLALGLVGTDLNTSQPRFTFGIDELRDGVSFVPMAIGLFGVAGILRTLEAPEQRDILNRKLSRLLPTLALVLLLTMILPAVRSRREKVFVE